MSGKKATSPSTPRPRRGLRIAHIDDMRELRDILRQSLGRDGHVVESFSDGAALLARVKQEPAAFDVLISDHHMPRMNGLEVVRRLRELAYRGRIFIFSSEIDEDANNVYLELKVDLVLPKPIILAELRQLLAEVAPG
jgi:CheY-like chemotaxis protein